MLRGGNQIFTRTPTYVAKHARTTKNKKFLRLNNLVASTLITGLAVLLGLGGAGGTYALINSTSTASGGTIQAGTMILQINNSSSAALGNSPVTPNSPATKAFSVTNTSSVGADITGSVTTTETATLLGYATARITPVANQASCSAGLSGTQGALSGYKTSTSFSSLAAGETRWFCLELGLKAGTSGSVSGQTLNFTLTIDGAQNAN